MRISSHLNSNKSFGRSSSLRNPSLSQISPKPGAIHSPVARSLAQDPSFGGNISRVKVSAPEALAQLKEIKSNPPPWIRIDEDNKGDIWLTVDADLASLHANPACIYDDVETTPWWGYHPFTNVFFPPPEEETTAHYSVANTLVREAEGEKSYEALTPEEELELEEIANGTLNAKVEDYAELIREDDNFLFGLFEQESAPIELTATVEVQEAIEPAEEQDPMIGFLEGLLEEIDSPPWQELGPALPELTMDFFSKNHHELVGLASEAAGSLGCGNLMPSKQ